MLDSIDVLGCHIPAGTQTSTATVNAFGYTNTIVGFAPVDTDIIYVLTVDSLVYNGVPIVIAGTFTQPSLQEALIAVMDAIVSALTVASGVTWSYEQISTYDFYLTASYLQNGDTVTATINVGGETFSYGLLFFDVVMGGGVAPELPVTYRTEEDNCFTEQEIQKTDRIFGHAKY